MYTIELFHPRRYHQMLEDLHNCLGAFPHVKHVDDVLIAAVYIRWTDENDVWNFFIHFVMVREFKPPFSRRKLTSYRAYLTHQ